jgi:hypothetical protein
MDADSLGHDRIHFTGLVLTRSDEYRLTARTGLGNIVRKRFCSRLWIG